VVGVDLKEIDPLGPPVELLTLDFTEPEAGERIREVLGGPADVLLSDAAPQLTGIVHADRGASEELYDAVLRLIDPLLRPGGRMIMKGFPGPEAQAFRAELRHFFGKIREVRPDGKRATSKEFYWVALDRREPRA